MADSKKYDGSQWEHSLRKLTTATEAVENPLYSDGTAITAYTIKGNTVQSGTPSPSSPISVNGVGELETTGEHMGEYKIPILNGQQTTNVYLGSTQTTRQIKKLVLDGTESWAISLGVFYLGTLSEDYLRSSGNITYLSNRYEAYQQQGSAGSVPNGKFGFGNNSAVQRLYLHDSTYSTVEDFKAYLAAQYAAGTPVCIWYVLATPKIATVNEPLMKIGNYADTLSDGASIPTTQGTNTIAVDTTVQPSEFTATWTGWHNADVKKWDGSAWS